jgi:hypothetical protein
MKPNFSWATAPILLALVAGCNVPNLPGTFGAAPTLKGQLQGGATASSNMRVGLLGALQAGQALQELVSAPVNRNSYTLQLPGSPPLSLMINNETQSIAFTLEAYQDPDNDGHYQSGETTTAVSTMGSIQFFTSDGGPGGPRSGWNVYQNGTWTQSFNVAFNLQPSSGQ